MDGASAWCLPPAELGSYGAIGARLGEGGRDLDACVCPSEQSPPAECRCFQLDLEAPRFVALESAGGPRPSNDGLTRRPLPHVHSALLEDAGARVCPIALADAGCASVKTRPPAPGNAEVTQPNPAPSVADDGKTLAIVRLAPAADDPARRVVEIYDVASSRLLRTIVKRDVGYADGIYDAYFVGNSLFVLETGAGPPVIGWIYDPRSGRVLFKHDGTNGLFPARVRDGLWAFVSGDGSEIEWRHTADGRREARLDLDGDGGAIASSSVVTLATRDAAELLVAVSGSPTAAGGTVFVVDLAGARLLRRFTPPVCVLP